MNLKNKIVLVTGGAVRIGRAITLEMVKSGAKVYCHYHSSETKAKSLKNEIKGLNGELYLIKADFTKTTLALDILSKIIEDNKRIDVLINNAALFIKTSISNLNESDWDTLFCVNLKTPFFISQKFGLIMKKQGFGKIINIGDTSGLNPWTGYLPYSLSKSGIISMTKGLAKALAPEVLVNCVNPGPVLIPDYYNEKEIKKAVNKTLIKRTGNPNDIVQTIKYLIEGTDYITGSVINVDGGRSIN